MADMNSERQQRAEALIRELRRDFRETASSTGIPGPDPRLLETLRRVPRDAFVEDLQAAHAWENRALPIGHGQTISQPFVVALMTQLLELTPDSRVLEIGTGSGYQAAVLAEMAGEVHTVEVVPELAELAAQRLARLGYRNVQVHGGNGRLGWPEAAPFDAILVAAGSADIPPALVQQLGTGGRLVIPLASHWAGQDLVLATKDAEGALQQRNVLAVMFVPLVGGGETGADVG
jgi:protein-L-isoaspartate(D-aspartate) O-methyltransferase